MKNANPRLGVAPYGTLLDFRADLSRDFGFAYERFLNFAKDSHSHDRFVFCAARGSCTFEVTDLRTGRRFVNSKDTTVFKAPWSPHSLVCKQTIYENLVFLPTQERVRKAFDEGGFPKSGWLTISSGIRQLHRSTWFNALIDRYFQIRVFAPSDQPALAFVEDELLREVLIMALGDSKASESDTTRAPPPTSSSTDRVTPIRKALEAIELSLFSKLDLSRIAKSAGLSKPSLLREFNLELGTSPIAYVRQRKLEEAARLLERKGHTVSEVSLLVGYENVSAFCRAYKARYGASPAHTLRIPAKSRH